MGNRANVAIVTDPGIDPIVLYTHWDGSELPEAVEAALQTAKPRWDDPNYFARIVVHKVLALLGADPDSETGFGLDVGRLCDNSYPIIVLHRESKEVHVVSEADFDKERYTGKKITFDDAHDGAIRKLRDSIEA